MKHLYLDRPFRLLALIGVSALTVAGCGPPYFPPAESWAWSGGVGARRAQVVAKAAIQQGDRLRLATSQTLDDAVVVEPTQSQGQTHRFELDGLEPATRYYYALQSEDVLGGRVATFKTFPRESANFKLAFGSCADTGSNHPVFDTIRQSEPDLFLLNGDLHYENIGTNDVAEYRSAYDRAFFGDRRAALHEAVATAYVWDDHDYGPNDSDGSSPGRSAAQQAYREVVPHYELSDKGGAIYQAFSYGRVRIVMTDTRSHRDADAKTMLGEVQRDWLIEELTQAHESHALVLWVSSVGWIGSSGDSWGGFSEERTFIAKAIAERGLDRIVMLSGDAHMLAIDDGSNNLYGNAGPGFVVFHAGPLDRPPSTKGGPYSEGTSTERGQFGLVEVTDDGGSTVDVVLRGVNAFGATVMSHSLVVQAPPQTP